MTQAVENFIARTAGTIAVPETLSHATWDALTLSIPRRWLCAVLYGDTIGLDQKQAAAFSRWLYDMTMEFGNVRIGKVSEAAHYARYHDAAEYGEPPCMCHNVEFLIRDVSGT